MASRNQFRTTRRAPPSEFVRRQDDDEPEIQRAEFGATNKRPRLIGSSSQSPAAVPQRLLRIHSPIQQSGTGSNSFRTREVESDHFTNSRSEREEEEEEEEEQQQQEPVTDSTLVASPSGGSADSGDGRNAVFRPSRIDSYTTMMLTDKSLLHCPGCNKPLKAPIYQCENGHISCSSCCAKTISVCLSCTSPIGFIRNLVMEKLADSIKTGCKNSTTYRCKEIMIYHELVQHEEVCPHTTCLCPYPSCSFTESANKLYDHFGTCHPSSATPFTYDTTFDLIVESNQKHVFLQERNERVIFILNHELQENNRTFNVDCIGPGTFNRVFVYQLTAKYKETCLSLQAVPEVCVEWEEHAPSNNYLTVPTTFSNENVDQFSIRICIKKSHPVE